MSYKVILLFVLFAVTFTTVIPHLGKVKSHYPRNYNVSLDDTPLQRWRPIIKDYKHALWNFMNVFELLPIPTKFFDAVQWYGRNIFRHKDFVAEIDAISQLSGHAFGRLFFLNFMYEFSTIKACSGIIVRNYQGKIIHGRNLDFEMWNMLSKLLVNIQYHQGKKLIFSIDAVVGSVFALTGIRHGAFAVNVDTRKGTNLLADLISVFIADATPNVWLLRQILEQQVTYANALNRLLTQRIAAPVYYIISGVKENEGAIIERDPNGVHNFTQLTDTNWFLIQTNYDRNEPDPFHDPRRIGVENRLRKYGNRVTEKSLFDDFMTLWPTFNIGTIMTAIMVPGTGFHNTTAWYQSNPSAPQTLSDLGLNIDYNKLTSMIEDLKLVQ